MKIKLFFKKTADFLKFLILVFKNLTILQKIVAVTLIIILFSFIISIFFGKNSIIEYYKLKSESKKYQSLVEKETYENEMLKNKINLIKINSNDYVDEILKAKFNKSNNGVKILKDE